MSLLTEFNEALLENAGLTPDDVSDYISGLGLVHDEYVESGRWTERWTSVFQREDEYVALDYEVPATEMQEDGDFYSMVYPVEPVQVTTTRYEKLTDY